MRRWLALAVLFSTLGIGASRVPIGAAHLSGMPGGRACTSDGMARLIDCLRSASPKTPARARSWAAIPPGKTLVYASAPLGGEVSISSVGSKGLTPVGSLTFSGSLPIGLTVDGSQNLYVALTAAQGAGAVDVFPRGATKPSKVYTRGLTQPEDVAVDSQGTLYVANFSDTSDDCSVVEYAKHSMKPTAVIRNIPGCLNAVTVDSTDNLYVTYVNYPPSGAVQSDVLKYAPKSTKGVPLNLKAPGGNFFWGIAVDAKGTIVLANVQEIGTVNQILIFPTGSKSPTRSVQYGHGWFPNYFALAGNRFFTGAFMVDLLPPGVPPGNIPAEFDYPSGRELFVESPKHVQPEYFFGFAVSP